MGTAGKIQALLNNIREKPVSKKAVKRRLASSELNGRVAVPNPFYDPKINARDCYEPRSTSIIPLTTGKKVCLQVNPKFSFTEIVHDFMSDAEVMKEC